MTLLTIVLLLLGVITIAQVLLSFVLAHQVAELRLRLSSGGGAASNPIMLGTRAPTFDVTDLRSGERVSSATMLGTRTYLLFVSTDCGVCRNLARELASASMLHSRHLVMYCNGRKSGCGAMLSELPQGVRLFIAYDRSISAAFAVPGFPTAAVLDEKWRIAGFRYPSSAEDVVSQLNLLADTDSTSRTEGGAESNSAESREAVSMGSAS